MSMSEAMRENVHLIFQKRRTRQFDFRQNIMDLMRRVGPTLVSSENLKVKWSNAWHVGLDEVLQWLPETEDCSHDLYRLLLQPRGQEIKPIATVIEKKEPVALIGLRQEGFHWTLATQWLLPGALFPAKPGYVTAALEALGLDLSIGWWRQKISLPVCKTLRKLESTPVHGMKCCDDFEQYWHETGFMKTIRKTRNRCRDFTFHVNVPGALEWTIRNWHEKWSGYSPESSTETLDRFALAEALQAQGKHFTFSLKDNERIIGGATLFVQQNDLVAGVCYRESEYDWHGVGDSLLEHIFAWAANSRYDSIDIGGGHEYKKHWAPLCGQKWLFRFTPSYLYYPKKIYSHFRRINYSKEIAPVT